MEHFVSTVRCVYNHAEKARWIRPQDNPARHLSMPARRTAHRYAILPPQLAEICHTAATTGDDPALDSLLLRLHLETACRRGGGLALRPQNLDPDQCLIWLREKGGSDRWQPGIADLDDAPAPSRRRARRTVFGPVPALQPPTPDHEPTPRPPPGPDRRRTPVGRYTRHHHPQAAPHHPHLGRTHLQLRRRPRRASGSPKPTSNQTSAKSRPRYRS